MRLARLPVAPVRWAGVRCDVEGEAWRKRGGVVVAHLGLVEELDWDADCGRHCCGRVSVRGGGCRVRSGIVDGRKLSSRFAMFVWLVVVVVDWSRCLACFACLVVDFLELGATKAGVEG